jgi:hypothetical protein
LAGDLDEHRRSSDLASQFPRAGGPSGDLQQPGQGLLAGRSPGGNATPGEQRLSTGGIQGATSPEAGKK